MAAKKPGRPTKYTDKLANNICARLAMGESMRSVCADKNMPALSTVFKWLAENKTFSEQYARAKQESADAMAEDILDIADDGHNDWMVRHYGRDEVWVENGEAINRSRLRVDTRKWLMSKMKPKKYGDKLDLMSGGERLQTTPVIISQIAPRANDASTEAETSPGS